VAVKSPTEFLEFSVAYFQASFSGLAQGKNCGEKCWENCGHECREIKVSSGSSPAFSAILWLIFYVITQQAAGRRQPVIAF